MATAGSIRRRVLLVLTAAVLAVHWLALPMSPAVVRTAGAARPLLARTLTGSAPAAASLAQAAPMLAAQKPGLAMHGQKRTLVLVRAQGKAAPATKALPTRAMPAAAASAQTLTSVAALPPSSSEPSARAALPDPASQHAFAIARAAHLRYQVNAQARGLALQGQANLLWQHDSVNYEATLEVSASFLPTRIQRSTGQITAEGLAPLRFSDKSRSEEAAHFERDKGKVSFSSNRPDAPLRAGAQDRLSVMLQLGAMIAGQPQKFPPGTTIEIETASARDAEPWFFTVEGEEELQLPGGTVAALKLVRNPRKEFDQKVELWLAPRMDYVPVRLRLTQPNGDFVDQQWTSTDKG